MLNRFLNFKLCLLCAVSCVPFDAMAGQECKKPPFEMVTTLFHPDPGAYSVWTGLIGEPKMDENYRSGVPLEGGNVFVVGEVREHPAASPSLLLAKLDERGRKEWSFADKIEGLKEVKKILPMGDGTFVILMNVGMKDGTEKILLGFYDQSGKRKNHVILSGNVSNINGEDFIFSRDKKNLIVAVTQSGAKKKNNMKKESGILILDTKGVKIRERFFVLGNNSALKNISSFRISEKEDAIIATGWFENDYQKKIGWVLLLKSDGELVWQREFERGLSASIEKSSFHNNQSLLVFGEVVPADSGSIGSWLMDLSLADGRVLWQRYYEGETGAHDYRPRGVSVNRDGLIVLAMQAKTDKTKKQVAKKEKDVAGDQGNGMVGDLRIPDLMDYVHVLTLDPRGITLGGDSYFEGQGMELSQMLMGVKWERLLIGSVVREDGDIPALLNLAEDVKQGGEAVEQSVAAKPKLPEVVLSEKTLKGLALLGSKMKGEKSHEKQTDSGESKNGEGAIVAPKDDGKSYDGAVVMATSPEAYSDPCVSKVKTLNSQ